MTRTNRSDWFAGVLVGLVVGVLFWMFPTLAVPMLALFAVISVVRTRRAFGLSGLLIGLGSSWLVVLARSILECRRFDQAPGQECTQPDVTPWLAAGATLLVLGLVGSVAAWRRG